jgi:hypothetical protein
VGHTAGIASVDKRLCRPQRGPGRSGYDWACLRAGLNRAGRRLGDLLSGS